MGLLSECSLLDFRKALSTAELFALTIKSAYLFMSLVDLSPEKSAGTYGTVKAVSSADLNHSQYKETFFSIDYVRILLCWSGQIFTWYG